MPAEPELVEIIVDGLSAFVDEAEYLADPDGVAEKIRAARAEASDLTGIHEAADWDYDSLVSAFGEDA